MTYHYLRQGYAFPLSSMRMPVVPRSCLESQKIVRDCDRVICQDTSREVGRSTSVAAATLNDLPAEYLLSFLDPWK